MRPQVPSRRCHLQQVRRAQLIPRTTSIGTQHAQHVGGGRAEKEALGQHTEGARTDQVPVMPLELSDPPPRSSDRRLWPSSPETFRAAHFGGLQGLLGTHERTLANGVLIAAKRTERRVRRPCFPTITEAWLRLLGAYRNTRAA